MYSNIIEKAGPATSCQLAGIVVCRFQRETSDARPAVSKGRPGTPIKKSGISVIAAAARVRICILRPGIRPRPCHF